jgi:hypothetical protein
MRISITPLNFGGETATNFSAESHRITRGNVVSSICFWSAEGRKLSERDAMLTTAQYLEWCALSPTDDDDNFLTLAHASTLGLEVVGSPTATPMRWRVSRDTIWTRVKSYIGDAAALGVLQAMPEAQRLDWLSNDWYWSDNALVRGFVASLSYESTDENDQAVTISLNPDEIMGMDPYL